MKQKYRVMLEKKKKIMECKNGKANLYESLIPREDAVEMYQCSKTINLFDTLGNVTFYGVDPGVRTIATCMQMNAEDAISCLSLSLSAIRLY